MTKEVENNRRLIVLLVVFVVLAIVLSGVYYWNWKKNKEAEPEANVTTEQQALLDKTLPGTIESVSNEKIVLTLGSAGKKEVFLTDKTTYGKYPSGGGVIQEAKLGELKANVAVIVTLTGKKTDSKLIAEKIEIINPPTTK